MRDIKVNRSGFSSLPLILGFLALLVGTAVTGSIQSSSARKALEKSEARRMLAVVAGSAFEEAVATLEERYRSFPNPTRNLERRLKQELTGWKDGMTIEVPATRRVHAGDALTVTGVTARSSDWVFQMDLRMKDKMGLIREIAVLELATTVTVKVGATTETRKFTARRYMSANVDPGQEDCRLLVQPNDMVTTVTGD